MPNCPLCHKPLIRNCKDPSVKVPIREGDPADFYCETYVDVHPGRRWCHYNRRSDHHTNMIEYYAQVPPFRFHLVNDHLTVATAKWTATGPRICDQSVDFTSVYNLFPATLEDMHNAIKRFQNLKAFI